MDLFFCDMRPVHSNPALDAIRSQVNVAWPFCLTPTGGRLASAGLGALRT